MTRVYYGRPPALAGCATVHDAGQLCLVCLMFAKGDQVARTRDIWQPLVNDGDDTSARTIPWADKSTIREADLHGICDLFPGLLVPLCWDHLGAIAPPDPAPPDPAPPCTWCSGTGRKPGRGVQPATALPPGLNGGKTNRRR